MLTPITVDAIGVYDTGSDGLRVTSDAGLFTGSGVLLRSATISGASTPVASPNPSGRWLFESFAPLILTPGDYRIGNVFYDGSPLAALNAFYATVPGLAFGAGA